MKKSLLNLVVLGLVGTTCSVAAADTSATTPVVDQGPQAMGVGVGTGKPFVINIAGATLMENFLKAPASANDFLDVDGDSFSTPVVDNLQGGVTPDLPSNPYTADLWWIVQYRVVGSVNGVQEVFDFGLGCVTAADTGIQPQGGMPVVQNVAGVSLSSDVCQLAYVNSSQYIVNGDAGGTASALFRGTNPGGLPVRSYCTGAIPAGKTSYSAVPFLGAASTQDGGSRIDIGPTDVPIRWVVRTNVPAGNPTDPTALPATAGYGQNPRPSRLADGTPVNFGFQLAAIAPGSPANLPGDPGFPNEFSVFETDFAYTSVSYFTNLGTGLRETTYTTLRHLFTTGRTDCGENLMACTRDTGSGTHNAVINSICIDPSFGVGEAIGFQSSSTQEQQAGPFFVPGNKSGSSGLDVTVQNTRLGISYSGSERAFSPTSGTAGIVGQGRVEALGVLNDMPIGGGNFANRGTVFARPTINNILGFATIDFTAPFVHVPLANRYNGYNIGGPGVMTHFGDPRSSLNLDEFGLPVVGHDPANTNPAMRNVQAAAYLNNITRSRDAFAGFPAGSATNFSPGQFLASTLFIAGSRAYEQGPNQPCEMVAAGTGSVVPINDALVAATAGANANRFLSNTFGAITLNGRTTTRFTLPVATDRYSDTRGTGASLVFVRQDGTTVGYGNTDIRSRNRIAGDFNGDGLRNLNDSTEMLRAWWDRTNRPADTASFNNAAATNWVAPIGTGAIAGAPGSDAIIELLGDFNADGNFGRIWNDASGMFMNDTTDVRYWADGLALDPVTGKLNRCEGFRLVDVASLAVTGNGNFFGTTKSTAAAYAAGDSVADVAGDDNGATFAVERNFTPGYRPIGFDGVINATDIDYVFAQFARNPNVTDGELNWSFSTLNPVGDQQIVEAKAEALLESQYAVNAQGEIVGNLSADINGDLKIDINDVTKIITILGGAGLCDINLDGTINDADRAIIAGNIGTAGGWARGDVNGDLQVTQADLDVCFAAPVCCLGDSDSSGSVNFGDITSTLANLGNVGTVGQQNPGDADCSGSVNFTDITTILANLGSNCN